MLRQLSGSGHQPKATDGQVRVLRSWTAVEGNRPVPYLVYHHPWWIFPTGLRRLLDEVNVYPLDTPSDSLDPAEDLVTSDVEEPLGTVAASMAPDEAGVWWWGRRPLPADEHRRGPAPEALRDTAEQPR